MLARSLYTLAAAVDEAKIQFPEAALYKRNSAQVLRINRRN